MLRLHKRLRLSNLSFNLDLDSTKFYYFRYCSDVQAIISLVMFVQFCMAAVIICVTTLGLIIVRILRLLAFKVSFSVCPNTARQPWVALVARKFSVNYNTVLFTPFYSLFEDVLMKTNDDNFCE